MPAVMRSVHGGIRLGLPTPCKSYESWIVDQAVRHLLSEIECVRSVCEYQVSTSQLRMCLACVDQYIRPIILGGTVQHSQI